MHDFIGLLYCFIVLLCICVVSCPYVIYYSTVMAQYSLFVLKVQLNPKQTYKTNSLNSHAMDVSNNHLGPWKQFTPLERELNLQQNLCNISTGNLNTWLHYPVKHKNAKTRKHNNYPRRARSALSVDTVLTLDVCMFVCMLGL